MDRAGKAEILGEIKEAFANVSSIVIADYRGLTVPVVTAMRDDFRKNGCHYRVLKNSLVKIAVKGSSLEPLGTLMSGTTAVIWSNDTPQTPAKLALKWAKDQPKVFSIKGGFFDGQVLDAKGRRRAVAHAGQGRDPRQPADDVPRGAAGLRPHRHRRSPELHVRPRRSPPRAREVGVVTVSHCSSPVALTGTFSLGHSTETNRPSGHSLRGISCRSRKIRSSTTSARSRSWTS
jgi:ribosomal protein L10